MKERPIVRAIRRNFKPEFHGHVMSGRKCQTVRRCSKRPHRKGDIFIAEAWTGKPYRSTVKELTRGTVTEVFRVSLNFEENKVHLLRDGDEPELFRWQLTDPDEFAILDGFADFDAMREWFWSNYGFSAFEGECIRWKLYNNPKQKP